MIFELVYTNNGNASISTYDVVDYWPGTLAFVSANPQPTTQTPTPEGLLLRWAFTTPIAPGASGAIMVYGTIR